MASLAVALLAVLAIVVAATQADGRNASREDTNDGGAWLLDQRGAAVGHVDRASRQVSGAVQAAETGELFDIDQADGVVVVHNSSADTVTLVDPRTYSRALTIDVPTGAVVQVTDGALVVATLDPLRVWRIPAAELGELGSVEDGSPVIHGNGAGLVDVTVDGAVIAVDAATGVIHHVAPDGEGRATGEAAVAAAPLAISAVGPDVVVVDADGVVTTWGESGLDHHEVGTAASDGVLQQPGVDASGVVFVDAEGRVVRLDRGSGDTDVVAELPGTSALEPIVHGGCVFTVTTRPAPTFARVCGDDVYTQELHGLSGSELRLRLVNGWVWVNAIDSGDAWVIDLDGDLDEVEDVGDALAQEQHEGEEIQGSGPNAVQRSNPDGDNLGNRDQLRDGPNEPPIARDDEVDARTDRPVVVDVLANDDDPDGDVILVESVDGIPAGAVAVPTANRGAVQVTPAAAHEGTVTFTYAITDGHGGSDDARVTVRFSPADEATNRPPEPVDDVAATAPGKPVSLDLLSNDTDPDGDTMALTGVSGEGGRIVWAPSGSLTFTPEPTTSTNLELSYTVADDFGATAEGRVVVNIRPVDEDSRPPDARNDAAVTVVDKPVILDVVANDIDPDGDPLTVSAQPTLVRSPRGGDAVYTSMTTDGSFLVDADTPGTYVWLYTVSDGANSDSAQIRVEVASADQNRPPVAVRDDIVIPVGGTRVVPVLRNDGDPDGDVIDVVNWTGSPGLLVEELPGAGFRVTALDTASPREVFQYEISDGVNDPVGTSVVVTVTDVMTQDQPPVAEPDIVEVQPGQPTTVDVLANDHDPEGGPLRVIDHSDPEEATATIGPEGAHVVLELPASADTGFTFGYEVEDESGNRGSSTVQVRVVRPEDPNRPPVARPDIVTTLEEQPVAVNAVANDSDPDGDVIRVESVAAQPDHGTVELADDGSLVYTPRVGFTGTDRFGYTLVDARGARVRGDVLVGVMPRSANRPPQAVDDVLEVVAGDGAQPLDVLANDRDPDGDPLRVVDASTPSTGRTQVAADGVAVLYTPPGSIDGDESEVAFRYTIDDGAGHQDDAIVTVRILAEARPRAPIARDDQAGPTTGGSTVEVDVLANDEDPDGEVDDLQLSSRDPAAEVEDGQLSITVGDETRSYVYTVTDADDLEASASVTVVVLDNRPPTVEPLRVETAFETPVELQLADQATDPDGDELTFTCCDGQSGGSAQVDSRDSSTLDVTFEPDSGFDGEASFSYRVDDGAGHEVSGSVVITVLPPTNRPPEAGDTQLDVEVGRSVDLDLGTLVDDPDVSDTVDVSLGGVRGPMRVSLSGSVATITPDDTASGETGTFTYTAQDGAGETDDGQVTVSITESSLPPPEARADEARTTQEVAVDIPALANDVGEELRIVSASVADGTISVSGDERSLTYTPDANFSGTTQASYVIRDRFDTADRSSTGQVTIDVVGYPDQPVAPDVVTDSQQATLTWSAPEDNGGPIDGYRLLALVDGEVTDQVEIDATTTYTWTGLDNGTTYTFRVQAHNEAGWGPASASSVEATPDTLPGRPSPPTATFGDGQLEVTWERPPNDGTPITAYDLEIGGGTSGSRTVDAQGATTTYVWDGLTNGTDYTFRVRARNDKGVGDFSAWSEPEHPLTEPSAPAKPTLENGPNYLDVNWNVPNNGGDTISEYEIEIEDESLDNRTVSGESTTSYRWSELPNGVEFRFRVRAANRDPDPGAWSPWSDPGKACDVPAKPGDVAATRGDQLATVSWTAPNNRGCEILRYRVRVVGTTNVQTTDGSNTSMNFTGLTNGQSYRFEVQAVNEIGRGAWSAQSNAVTPAGPPTAPVNVETTRTDDRQITTTVELSDPNGAEIIRYEVSLNSGPWNTNFKNVACPSGGRCSTDYRYFEISGLNYDTRYCVRVRAVNEVGPSSASNARCARTLGPPGTPGGFSASSLSGAVRFSWNKPSGGVDYYRVGRYGHSNLNVSSSPYDWPTTFPTKRTARVKACNAAGCSDWTAFKSARPKDPRTLTISKGASAQGLPGCSSSSCRWIDVEVRNFAKNRTLTLECRDKDGVFYDTTFSTDGSGNADLSRCYYGFPGNEVWVRVPDDPGGAKKSNVIVW